VPDGRRNRGVGRPRRQEGGDGSADAIAVLHPEQREVVGHATGRGLAVSSFADEDIGLVLERAGIVRIGALDLRQKKRDILEPGIRVRPAQEAVIRTRLALVMARVELLEVLPPFCLGACQRDLDQLPHLRRPAAERLDELAQREAAGWLGLKSVLMNVLHGRPYTSRRAPSPAPGPPCAGLRMRRAGRIVAVGVATLLALPATAPPAPIHAAGPPLRFVAGPAGSLDPAYIGDASDVQLLLQLYAGLTRLDEAGEPYPSLASGWEVSDDGLTYRFSLRDDLAFSDGSALTADDVRRSWLRLLDPATAATAPDVLTVIEGASARSAGDVEEDAVGIEAPDDTTLVVRLRHPASYFVEITATPATFVVPPKADATPTWQTPESFLGSGPYVVDGTDGADLLLRANEHYVAGPPPIDEIRWMAATESNGATAFSSDAVDLVQVPGWDATWIAFDADLGPHLHAAEPLSVSYFGFDTARPPFDDERVRRAFALAIDRERLVPLAEGASAAPAASLVPPAIWPDGFSPEFDHDPEEARRLLEEAGYADRSDLGTIVVSGSGLDVGPAVEIWREELGVDIEVEVMDFGAYLDTLDSRPPGIFTISWIADYPSPHSIYGLLLEPGASSNYGDWRDERFAELLEEAARVPETHVGAAYDAVDAYVAEQAPIIPWAYGETWWLVADGLRGLGNLTTGLLDFGRVSWDR
jgi:oligopeptide transport system substrate-binding protein